jgi:hypothetical protein
LQHDPHHPARALPHRRAEGVREIFARGQQAIALAPQRHEHLRAAHGVDAPAVFVVFRQAFGIEHAVGVRGRQLFQHRAREGRAHAIARQKAAPHLPHRDVLGLKLGEFVAVQAVYPLPQGRGQRQHGHLHHVVASGEVIDPAQRFRVDHVLRIVRHDRVEAHAVALLVRQHALIDPVEAVGLGRGTVVRAQRQVYPRKLARGFPHGGVVSQSLGYAPTKNSAA